MTLVLTPEVLIALAVVVFTCLLLGFLKWRLRGSGRDSVLLVGLSGSGKTALLSQIMHHHASYTVTSMIANVVSYNAQLGKKRKTVRLCDLPGEDRLRTVCLESYLPTARGIIFVVDSSTLQNNLKGVAQFLFELLTNDIVVRNRVAVLIACNKQDLAQAKSTSDVRSSLEGELAVVRNTYIGSLESSASSTLLSYKQSGQSRVREMTADIRASRAVTARVAQVFGNSNKISFDKVEQVLPLRFTECSAGRVDETLPSPSDDALKSVSGQIDDLRLWIASL